MDKCTKSPDGKHEFAISEYDGEVFYVLCDEEFVFEEFFGEYIKLAKYTKDIENEIDVLKTDKMWLERDLQARGERIKQLGDENKVLRDALNWIGRQPVGASNHDVYHFAEEAYRRAWKALEYEALSQEEDEK